MIKRIQLSNELHDLLRENGYPENVYYQPPSSVMMEYPCVRYNRSDIVTMYADNLIYSKADQYTLIVIDPDPDSKIPDILMSHFTHIKFDRPYTANNLNHFVFTLFY